jgi:hypothetical protein
LFLKERIDASNLCLDPAGVLVHGLRVATEFDCEQHNGFGHARNIRRTRSRFGLAACPRANASIDGRGCRSLGEGDEDSSSSYRD